MNPIPSCLRVVCLSACLLAAGPSAALRAAELPPGQVEFFETRIRPVLVEQCYKCHNSAELAEGGLAVDSRAALLKGGDSGPIVVAGKPAESRLLPILRHQVDGLKMPQNSGRLDDRVIADFEKWIALGVPDPRDAAPTAEELAQATSWESVLARRKQWWSLQPIGNPPPPPAGPWSDHPLDRFILAKLQAAGLQPAEPADAPTLVRRMFFAIIGLPPTPAEAALWSERLKQPGRADELADHLLASPHFGERWARHWMDWVRYAESHGSEGDPAIDNAWQFRDYLIRALNLDVPYDQLVREQIAGDLLEQPRINLQLGFNESLIGPAHWRMVFHGFAPTDALDEKVRFIDDQIGVFSKAFLGLTVSCARCHDHKFDAISQRDYYALFGILASCRPGRTAVDTPQVLNAHRDELAALKPRIRAAIATDWHAALGGLRSRLLAADGPWKTAESPNALLHPWFLLRKDTDGGVAFDDAWRQRVAAWQADRRLRDEHAGRPYGRRWNMAVDADYHAWFAHGNGLPKKPLPAGEFAVAASGDDALTGIYPAGVYSHRLSARHEARLSSGYVHLDDNYELWLRTHGDRGASARFVVQDYPRNGTVFPIRKLNPDSQWEKFDLTYWNGDDIHIELATAKDAPLMVTNEPSSWFGIREAVLVKKGDPAPPPEPREQLDPVFETAMRMGPTSFEDLATCYISAVTAAVNAWQAGTPTDAQALLLDASLKQNLLPGKLEQLAAAGPLCTEYRRLESQIAVPTRVPGLEEAVPRNERLMVRGNHKQPQDEVPRRFLEAIDPTPYQTPRSGRRLLAEDLLRDSNPLTRRVLVNRLWTHLFGRGIVATPDNFGRLGQLPTHPELLDYLATRFKDRGWSMKDTIRFIVTSRTWQASSRPSDRARQSDPDNLLLSHMPVRRLEAEAIRDSLLAVSGSLSPELYGPPVDGNAARRSVYVRVIRNALDPFLRAFDFPEPFSAVGRRDVTNVPAQSLTLMNDERVAALAAAWAGRVLSDPQAPSDEARLRNMVQAAFGRPASAAELTGFQTRLHEIRAGHAALVKQVTALRRQVNEQEAAVQAIVEPVRTRLLAEASGKADAGEQPVPQPIGRWEFETDLRDAIGTAHGEARDGARLSDGALILTPPAHVLSAPLTRTIRAKTLEAWVLLDSLDQRGGGVITIQSRNGAMFDAIVFGEQNPRQWMAGSNGFVRTQSFNGPQEQPAPVPPAASPAVPNAASGAVHVAIVYDGDGRIAGYRNGEPYGKPYQSNGPVEFKAGETLIGFGIRHLPAGGNRMLSGRILRAQLYDRALSADEIGATSRSAPFFISESRLLAALTEEERAQVTRSRRTIAALEREIAELGPAPPALDDAACWTDLARALFTFKEFIYLR